MTSRTNFSRRDFLRTSAAVAPFLAGGCFHIGYPAPRRPAASERINLAVIGCGGMGGANMNQFLQDPRVQITLVCDPIFGPTDDHPFENNGRDVFRRRVDAAYQTTGCRMTADWREVAADPTVDAVLIATPDYWHALMAIGCMRAGKHVYCQKPLSLGINEGRAMVRVAKESGVTFQVGNQGRATSVKRIAAEIVRNRLIGELKRVTVAIPSGKTTSWWYGDSSRLTPGRAPSCYTKASWDLWLGPTQHWEDDAFIPAIHRHRPVGARYGAHGPRGHRELQGGYLQPGPCAFLLGDELRVRCRLCLRDARACAEHARRLSARHLVPR